MRVPKLNRRMVLETRVETPNGSGGLMRDWQGLGGLWVAVLSGQGRESVSEGLATGEVPLRIVVRAAPPGSDARPQAGQRLREGGRIFRILAVAEADPDARYLTCFSREEVPV